MSTTQNKSCIAEQRESDCDVFECTISEEREARTRFNDCMLLHLIAVFVFPAAGVYLLDLALSILRSYEPFLILKILDGMFAMIFVALGIMFIVASFLNLLFIYLEMCDFSEEHCEPDDDSYYEEVESSLKDAHQDNVQKNVLVDALKEEGDGELTSKDVLSEK